MTEQTLPDPDELLASIVERQTEMLTAGRKGALDALEACVESASALADSQEKLAAASEVEWLSRLLRAQAGFTRDMLAASTRFAREVMEEAQ